VKGEGTHMARLGLLTAYTACDNCGKCVEACRLAHGSAPEQSGLKLSVSGPFALPSGRVETYYIATPTAFCDGCGKCAQACPGQCIAVGEISALGAQMTARKMALFTLPAHPAKP